MAKWGENNFFCNHERLFGFAGMSSPPAKANVLKWSFNLFAIGTLVFLKPPHTTVYVIALFVAEIRFN